MYRLYIGFRLLGEFNSIRDPKQFIIKTKTKNNIWAD